MARTGKVPPEQWKKEFADFLKERGMTKGQFMATEEYREALREAAEARFTMPTGVPYKK